MRPPRITYHCTGFESQCFSDRYFYFHEQNKKKINFLTLFSYRRLEYAMRARRAAKDLMLLFMLRCNILHNSLTSLYIYIYRGTLLRAFYYDYIIIIIIICSITIRTRCNNRDTYIIYTCIM